MRAPAGADASHFRAYPRAFGLPLPGRERRRRGQAQLRGAGATLEEIALEFGVTTRWVSIVLKRPDDSGGPVLEMGGQMGLF